MSTPLSAERIAELRTGVVAWDIGEGPTCWLAGGLEEALDAYDAQATQLEQLRRRIDELDTLQRVLVDELYENVDWERTVWTTDYPSQGLNDARCAAMVYQLTGKMPAAFLAKHMRAEGETE